MCNDYSQLDDNIDDLFGSVDSDKADEAAVFAKEAMRHMGGSEKRPEGQAFFEEACPKCKGSGRFVSYSGNTLGACFTCKGRGKVRFKTSSEDRAAKREQKQKRKQKEAMDKMVKALSWLEENPTENEWLKAASARGFAFASNMITAILTYGSLTDKQLAAIRKCMAQDEERERERAEASELAPNLESVALIRIHQAFAKAVSRDIKYPKIRLDSFLFSLVRSGVNEGAIYVKSIAKDTNGDRRYMGKIVEGRLFKAYGVSDEEQTRIIAAAADPEAAAVAYGKREGACSICARKLTNHQSINDGIGPICKENFGW